jgi:hypothetical protein
LNENTCREIEQWPIAVAIRRRIRSHETPARKNQAGRFSANPFAVPRAIPLGRRGDFLREDFRVPRASRLTPKHTIDLIALPPIRV